MARAVVHRAGGGTEEIKSKATMRLSRGDRVVIETAGGGGWGDPRDRDRDAVAADVANRKVGAAAAAGVYGREAAGYD